jgi:tetratricopeptide (TPR) repeat protein
MARDGLSALMLGAGFVVVLGVATAAPPDDTDARLRTQLAVQTALQQGRDCLQRGDYQGAVYCLEREIARVNGSRDYLNALREAYRGYARELLAANKRDEAGIYLRRLQILDPGAHLDTPVVQVHEESTALPPRRPAGPAIRGQKPDNEPGDPFADSNKALASTKAPDDSARVLIDRAAEEFGRAHYLAAARLYQQASDLDPAAVTASREQWAYCRLVAVAEQLNRATGAAPELESEVRRALDMTTAPRLQSFGKELLHRIEEHGSAGSETAIEVKHTPAQGERWAEAESANFRIVHRQSQEFAEKVARIAEATRAAAAKKWFGDTPPAWTPKCTIYLHADGVEYSRLTGAQPESPGHSTMPADGQRGQLRRIDLRCDAHNLLQGVLPHETTHIVLFGRFGSKHLPRWADEGMAVHSEPRQLVELHLRNLPRYRQDRKLFSMAELVRMPDYPERTRVGAFYAESVSLVDYLSSQRGGCRVLAQFIRDGMDSGWEEALKQHYGIESFDELDRRWQDYAFGSASVSGKWR